VSTCSSFFSITFVWIKLLNTNDIIQSSALTVVDCCLKTCSNVCNPINVYLLTTVWLRFTKQFCKDEIDWSFVNINEWLYADAPSQQMAAEMISSQQREVTVVVGETLIIECVASGWPVPAVTWSRYGGQLPQQRHQQLNGWSFTFSNGCVA